MVRGIIMSDKNKNTENEVNDQNEELEPISKDEESPDETSEIDELKKLVDENWEKVLRLQAELDNLRKRTLKDIESANRGSIESCLLYTSPSPRDLSTSRMPSSA